ncbi:MAG TPA: NAD(P)-dependent oxidoreductase [Gemmatimonadaceae bacterium]|nr:NAD(P)-dependent oxidoreductase [Gemmatimonadaceae bacterium]
MRVAFLGLGAIGTPMAAHLAKEPFELTVWNRTSEKADAFAAEHGCKVAKTAADAVRDAEVVITCLPSSREVEALLQAPDGIAAGLPDGSLFIDCTSGDPATSKAIAENLAGRRIDFVDAPVSGGVKGAVAGTLTIMCGGSDAAMDRARPVLSAFGKKIVHCGDVGAGDAVKAMNQALLAVHIWSGGEALATLAKLGVSASVALDVINRSSGRSNTSENLFTERVIGRKFPRTFKLALLDKDIGIAAAISAENAVPTPLIDLAASLISGAHRELGEEADHVEAVRVIESSAGVMIN